MKQVIGDRRQADDEADQLHRHVEQALNDLLEATGGRAVDQQQSDAERQGEEHDRRVSRLSDAALDDVYGNDVEEGRDPRGLRGALRDDFARPAATGLKHGLGLRRIDPVRPA